MLDISFQINGRNVTTGSFQDVFEKAVFEEIESSIKTSVGSLRCSTHHQSPKLKVKGKDLSNLSINVEGCCEELIEKTLARLS